MNDLYLKKKECTIIYYLSHNSFLLHSFLLHVIPMVICLVMPSVTRSKKAILCPGLSLLAKKRTRHTRKVQENVDENISVTFIIILPYHYFYQGVYRQLTVLKIYHI
jgi:hypothetical protein